MDSYDPMVGIMVLSRIVGGIFIILKLIDLVEWEWVCVLSPLWISQIVYLMFLGHLLPIRLVKNTMSKLKKLT